MGNIQSGHTVPVTQELERDLWWNNPRMSFNKNIPTTTEGLEKQNAVAIESTQSTENGTLSDTNKEKLNEFKLEFARKHEKRREIMAEKRKQFEDLRSEITKLKTENEQLKKCSNKDFKIGEIEEIKKLKEENESLRSELQEKNAELEKSEALHTKNNELRKDITLMQCELQGLNKEILEFEKEKHDYQAHVVALKDVIKVSKQMLQIRESQLKELREKVAQIEASLQGREMHILSQDLRNEYERQLQNIRNLRTLYEERQRTDKKEKQELLVKIDDLKKEVERTEKKNEELEERVSELEEENSKKYDEIMSLESNLGLAKAETRQYQAELTVINQLFSEILLGFTNSQGIDLDKLTKHLEEHHDLLKNIVINEISPEVASALPKVLLDLVNQVSNSEEEEKNDEKNGENSQNVDGNVEEEENSNRDGRRLETIVEESESQTSSCQLNSPEEIVALLPKVWRVLIELLSHQKAATNNVIEENTSEPNNLDPNPCYKTVQTPKGPSLVLSVSQTFIRLKDLILEKKSLEKEMNHLKQLNTHLENRLQDQEKRLELVSTELSKTWHVVGKLQKQHQLLHTQEKILRYELAQKRKLLTTLKEELESSREKRQQAREKNSNTEKQWRQLRVEFASRRNIVTDDFNNSTESGYSDERASSSDDEPGYETDISECNTQKASSSTECEDRIDVIESKLVEEIEEIENVAAALENEMSNRDNEALELENSSTTETDTTTIDNRESDVSLENEAQEYEDIETAEACSTELEKQEASSSAGTGEDMISSSGTREDCTSSLLGAKEDTNTLEEKSSKEKPPNIASEHKLDAMEEQKNPNTLFAHEYKDIKTAEECSTSNTDQTRFTTEPEKQGASFSSSLTREEELDVIEDQNKPSTSFAVAIYDNKQRQVVEYITPTTSNLLNFELTKAKQDKLAIVPEKNCDTTTKDTERTSQNETEVNITDKLRGRTFEEHLVEKEERLKRLEGQCSNLVRKVTNTTDKSTTISNKLDTLHEIYGDNSEKPSSIDVPGSSRCEESIETSENEAGIAERNEDFKESIAENTLQNVEQSVFEASDLLEIRKRRKIVDHVSYIQKLQTSEEKPSCSSSEGSSNKPLCEESKLDNEPSTSSSSRMTFEERLVAKEERLKRLEGQCNQLVQKVTNTSNKTVNNSNRLNNLLSRNCNEEKVDDKVTNNNDNNHSNNQE